MILGQQPSENLIGERRKSWLPAFLPIFHQKVFYTFNPLPDDKILDWSRLKQIADDISKCISIEK